MFGANAFGWIYFAGTFLPGVYPETGGRHPHHGGASLEWSEEQFRLWWENPRQFVIDAEEDDLAILLSML